MLCNARVSDYTWMYHCCFQIYHFSSDTRREVSTSSAATLKIELRKRRKKKEIASIFFLNFHKSDFEEVHVNVTHIVSRRVRVWTVENFAKSVGLTSSTFDTGISVHTSMSCMCTRKLAPLHLSVYKTVLRRCNSHFGTHCRFSTSWRHTQFHHTLHHYQTYTRLLSTKRF